MTGQWYSPFPTRLSHRRVRPWENLFARYDPVRVWLIDYLVIDSKHHFLHWELQMSLGIDVATRIPCIVSLPLCFIFRSRLINRSLQCVLTLRKSVILGSNAPSAAAFLNCLFTWLWYRSKQLDFSFLQKRQESWILSLAFQLLLSKTLPRTAFHLRVEDETLLEIVKWRRICCYHQQLSYKIPSTSPTNMP